MTHQRRTQYTIAPLVMQQAHEACWRLHVVVNFIPSCLRGGQASQPASRAAQNLFHFLAISFQAVQGLYYGGVVDSLGGAVAVGPVNH
jgi:hypothetical protein